MSRAMNVKLPEADVETLCRSKGISISAIEGLPSGDTHLVCTTSDDADKARRALSRHLIEGKVRRYSFYRPPPSSYS